MPSGYTVKWQPGLAGSWHSEVFACSREATGAALSLALAADTLRASQMDETDDGRSILWVQDGEALKKGGYPYRPGLPPIVRHRLLHVVANKPEDALFALEEGLRCRDLAAVIGEIAGSPRVLDFKASRRLSLAVERYGIPLWLVRLDAPQDLSSARLRWRVRSAPSDCLRWNAQAPGSPTWHAELFRARNHPPGEWILRDEKRSLVARKTATPDIVHMAAATGDRPLAAV